MKFQCWMLGIMLGNAVAVTGVHSADLAPGILGKHEWLFYRHEMTDASDAAKTNISIDLIQRFNKVLATNQIAMAVAMVPLKMRIYAEHLPDDFRMNDYMASNNERMTKALRSGGVLVLDTPDLIPFLPSNTTSFVAELVAPVTVTRVQPPRLDPMGRRIWSGLALNGRAAPGYFFCHAQSKALDHEA
jgi:hypothetical protein